MERGTITVASILGSIFVALPSSPSRFTGFVLWTLADIYWVIDAMHREDKEQEAMFAFFTFTSVLGIVSNSGIFFGGW